MMRIPMHQDPQSRIFYELSSLVLTLLRSSPASDSSLNVSTRSRLPSQITPAGFAWLMLGVSLSMMLCGSVTFLIGFMLMPWVICLVMVLYVVGVVSSISMLGRALFCQIGALASPTRKDVPGHQKDVLSTVEKSLDVLEVPETSSLSAELRTMEEPAVSSKKNNLHVLNSGEECLDDSKTLLVKKEVFEDANSMEDESEVVAANNQTKISKEMVRYTIVFESGFWKSCVLDDYVSGDCSRIKRGHSSVLEQVVRGHSVEEQMGALQAAYVQNDSERARQDRNAGSSFVQILQSVQDEVFSVDVVKGLRRTDEDARCISECDKGRAEGMLDTLWPCGKVVQGAVVFHAMMNGMHTESESIDMVIPSMYQGGLKHQRAFSEAAATLVAKGYDFVFSLNIILNVFTMCMIPRKGFCQPDFGGWNVDVTIPFDPGGGQIVDGQKRRAPRIAQGMLFDLEDKIVLRGDGNDVFSDVAFRNSLDDLPDWYYAAKDLVQIGGSQPAGKSLRNDRVKNVVQGTTFSSNVGASKTLIVLEQIRYSFSSVSQQLGQLRAAQKSSSQFSPAQSSSRQLVAAQDSSRQLNLAQGSSPEFKVVHGSSTQLKYAQLSSHQLLKMMIQQPKNKQQI